VRKYLFSFKTLAAAFGLIGLIRATVKNPRDWRTALLWVVWLSTLATAVGTVRMDARRAELEDS
jgi:cytochrome c-type biogenesis protein CcmH/NrfF